MIARPGNWVLTPRQSGRRDKAACLIPSEYYRCGKGVSSRAKAGLVVPPCGLPARAIAELSRRMRAGKSLPSDEGQCGSRFATRSGAQQAVQIAWFGDRLAFPLAHLIAYIEQFELLEVVKGLA